jgi:hypothetical protein
MRIDGHEAHQQKTARVAWRDSAMPSTPAISSDAKKAGFHARVRRRKDGADKPRDHLGAHIHSIMSEEALPGSERCPKDGDQSPIPRASM